MDGLSRGFNLLNCDIIIEKRSSYLLTFVYHVEDFNSTFAEDATKQEQKEQSNREWVSPVPEVEVGGSAPGGPQVRARKDIPRGARFGPFLGKWASEPFNPRYAWEVSCISYDTRACLSLRPCSMGFQGGA